MSYSFAIVDLYSYRVSLCARYVAPSPVMATPRNNLQDQRSRLQQLGGGGFASPFVAVSSPLVAGRVCCGGLVQRCIGLITLITQRGNALPRPGGTVGSIDNPNKPPSSVKANGSRASHHGKSYLQRSSLIVFAHLAIQMFRYQR